VRELVIGERIIGFPSLIGLSLKFKLLRNFHRKKIAAKAGVWRIFTLSSKADNYPSYCTLGGFPSMFQT
jgi:hypothetical protein